MTKIVELIIDENSEENKDGVFAISLVESPAMESDFIALSKEDKKVEVQFATQDKEKQLLTGAVLIPNKQILRIDKETGADYFVYFSKNTIRQASELFMMNNYQSNHTIHHKSELKHLTVVESWIKDNPIDKSVKYGFESLPEGTWFVSVKVNDKSVWDDYVKTGKVKGFSIEGYFTDKMELSKEKLEIRKNKKCADGFEHKMKNGKWMCGKTMDYTEEELLISKIKEIIKKG